MPLRPYQPTPPGCIELTFKFTLFGIPLAIVIFVCLDAGHAPSDAELLAVTTAGDTWMHFDMMGILSRDLIFLSTTGTDTSTETGHQANISHGAGVVGSIDSASMPSQLAQVITLYTAKRGRSFRGRSFIPGIPKTYSLDDANTLTVAGVGDIFTEYQAIDARLAAVSAKQAVISRIQHGVRLATCESNIVTSRNTNNRFETLRRRSAGAHLS